MIARWPKLCKIGVVVDTVQCLVAMTFYHWRGRKLPEGWFGNFGNSPETLNTGLNTIDLVTRLHSYLEHLTVCGIKVWKVRR
jgi:hypothetical protein